MLRDGSQMVHHKGASWTSNSEPCSDWLVDEGHMQHVWALAEGDAAHNKTQCERDSVRDGVRAVERHGVREIV